VAEAFAEADTTDEGEALVKEASEASNALEVGRTTLKIGDQASSFLRVKLQ